MLELLKKDGVVQAGNEPDAAWMERLVKILTERSHTLVEMKTSSLPFIQDSIVMDEKARAKHLTPDISPLLTELATALRTLEPFAHDSIEKVFNDIVTPKGMKLGKLAQPVRVALTGGTVSPDIFDVIEVMGRDKVVICNLSGPGDKDVMQVAKSKWVHL